MSIKPRATHDELIRKYRNREPRVFIQYGGNEAFDGRLADKDGDVVTAGVTEEMADTGTIQVFIDPDATKASVLRLLSKIHRFICESWDTRGVMLVDDIAERTKNERRNSHPENISQGYQWYRSAAPNFLFCMCQACADMHKGTFEVDAAASMRFEPHVCDLCGADARVSPF